MSSISHKIATYRQCLCISQSDLAKRMGVEKHTLAQYENGKNIPPLKAIMKISDILHVPLVYFVTDQEYWAMHLFGLGLT